MNSMEMEGSHSGLVRRPGKSVCLKGHREFESPTLRIDKINTIFLDDFGNKAERLRGFERRSARRETKSAESFRRARAGAQTKNF